MAVTERGSISIGSILGDSFAVIGRHPAVILGSALVFAALPSALWGYLARFMVPHPGQVGQAMSFGGVSILAVVAMLVLQAFVHIVILRVVSADRHGAVDNGEVFATAARFVLPLSGLYLLMYLGIVVGMALLVVPGFILLMMWSVAGCALVQEGTGIGGAFGRSRALTKGHRWGIFGLFLIALVVSFAVSAVLGLLTAGTASFIQIGVMRSAGQLPFAYTLANAVASALVISLFAAVYANLYFALRTAQEGPEVEALAEVFA